MAKSNASTPVVMPAVPGNTLIQGTTVDTLGMVECVLMFISNSAQMGSSKDSDTGMRMILDCCREAVSYEAQKLLAEGRL